MVVVATPGERCVLWDIDHRVGVDRPWGLPLDRIAEIEEALAQHHRPRTEFDIGGASPPLTGKYSLA